MLDGHGGGGMTVPHGDLETTLRRELTAAVGGVEPASDALERIRARTAAAAASAVAAQRRQRRRQPRAVLGLARALGLA